MSVRSAASSRAPWVVYAGVIGALLLRTSASPEVLGRYSWTYLILIGCVACVSALGLRARLGMEPPPAAAGGLRDSVVVGVLFWAGFPAADLDGPSAALQLLASTTFRRALLLEVATAALIGTSVGLLAWLAVRARLAQPHRVYAPLWCPGLTLALSSALAVGIADPATGFGLLLAGVALVDLLTRVAPRRGWWLMSLAAAAFLLVGRTGGVSRWSAGAVVGFALGVLLGSAWQLATAWGPAAWPWRLCLRLAPAVLIAVRLSAGATGAERPRESPAPRATSTRPHVVLVVIDTLRADHTGLAGYSKPTTPALDALAAESVVFTQAWSPGTATIPSVKSLFTGMRPSTAGPALIAAPPPPGLHTLAQAFRDSGYRTLGLSANWLIGAPGFWTGFDTHLALSGRNLLEGSLPFQGLLCRGNLFRLAHVTEATRADKPLGDELLAVARRLLEAQDHHGPLFLYFHLLEPHWPYYDWGYGLGPPATLGAGRLSHLTLMQDEDRASRWRGTPEFAELVGRYDEGVRRADAVFGDLLGELRRLDLYRDTLLVVVGDHGEELLEHGRFGHGHDVFPELCHVPFVLRLPPGLGVAPRRIEEPVSTGSLFATLGDLLGLGSPEAGDYPSLGPLLRGNPMPGAVITEAYSEGRYRLAYRRGAWFGRIGLPLGMRRATLRDVATGSEGPPPPEAPELLGEAVAAADSIAARWPGPVQRQKPSDRAMERLRALGYVK